MELKGDGCSLILYARERPGLGFRTLALELKNKGRTESGPSGVRPWTLVEHTDGCRDAGRTDTRSDLELIFVEEIQFE